MKKSKVIDRTTQSTDPSLKISVWAQVKILNKFICGGVPLCIQGWTDTLFHIRNNIILKYEILRQSLGLAASLLGNSCSTFSI